MADHQVSTIPVLKFSEISSRSCTCPQPRGYGCTPRVSVSHSQQAARQLLCQAPPSHCHGGVLFHPLLPQLSLHLCPRGQRRWLTKTETPQGQPLPVSSRPSSEASLVQSPSALKPEPPTGQGDPRSCCCSELAAAALNCSTSF